MIERSAGQSSRRWRPPVGRITSASSLARRIRRVAGCSSADTGNGDVEKEAGSAHVAGARPTAGVRRGPTLAAAALRRIHMLQGCENRAGPESPILANCRVFLVERRAVERLVPDHATVTHAPDVSVTLAKARILAALHVPARRQCAI